MSALRMRLLLRLNMCACLLLPFIPFNKITFPTSIRNFIKKTDGTVSRVLASAVIRHNHLSETQITLRLKQPTRSYGPENPLPLGFAPNEVCTAAPVTGCAGVSYTAFSPLPAMEDGRYIFCCTVCRMRTLHRCSYRIRPVITRHFFRRSPDFASRVFSFIRKNPRGYIPSVITDFYERRLPPHTRISKSVYAAGTSAPSGNV